MRLWEDLQNLLRRALQLDVSMHRVPVDVQNVERFSNGFGFQQNAAELAKSWRAQNLQLHGLTHPCAERFHEQSSRGSKRGYGRARGTTDDYQYSQRRFPAHETTSPGRHPSRFPNEGMSCGRERLLGRRIPQKLPR